MNVELYAQNDWAEFSVDAEMNIMGDSNTYNFITLICKPAR